MLEKNWMESRYTIGSLVARSAAMQRLVKQAGLHLHKDSPLLIVGEPGTGKSVLARAIHNSSLRSNRPYVSISASRLTPESLDKVLFGTTDGEQGAMSRSVGGSLVISDLEELAPLAQERLTQVLDKDEFSTARGERRSLDARLMFTGNSGELATQLSRGVFSESLYNRISETVLSMPTLAERNADIPYLVADVLQSFASRERVPRPSVPYHYMELLTRVEWPENVRQLRNHVESVMSLSNGQFDPAILLAHFEEIESPQTLKSLAHDLLQRLVNSPQTATASATN